MTTALLSAALVLLGILVVLALVLLKKVSHGDARMLAPRLDAIEKTQERTERAVREEVAQSREESGKAAREQRQELTGALKTLGDSVAQRMTDVATLQKAQLDAFSGQLAAFANTQYAQLEAMAAQLGKLSESNERKLESVRTTVEGKLQSIQSDNAAKLELMRATVEEKLQGTLDKRLGESFRQVSERLEQVYKGLGEMQSLATGVGDLKKVLTNVKTRGTWGEVQLGAMLEQVLNPDQYAANVVTKDGGGPVEYAVKLPGRGDDQDEVVWLPIDAKFPIEDYQRLLDAEEKGDAEAAEAAARQLENRVKACGRDIGEKYLNPPRTTDFGVLFLPIEGLFAEVVRRAGLADLLQRDHRVMIAGPTTLWSILNSLQMGFRTLAIQKRSSEVWNLLAAVKAEWSKYGEILDKVHRKLHEASDTIEKAQTRTRAIGRKLRDVQELPAADAGAALMLEGPDGDAGEDEKTA